MTLWEVDKLSFRSSLAAPPSMVKALAFTADGNLVTAAGSGGKVWDVATGNEHASWSNPPAADAAVLRTLSQLVSFSSDGRHVVAALSASGRPKGATPETYPVRVFDVVAGKQILQVTDNGKLSVLDLSPDGRWLVLGQQTEPATLWAPGRASP